MMVGEIPEQRIAAGNDKLQKAQAKSSDEKRNLAEKMGIPPRRPDPDTDDRSHRE